MATYAVGDVQGCYDELRRLLDQVQFDAANDRLWLVGDLVNRGPGSLATLRFVAGLGDAAACVLGNHDLHLLCVAEGIQKKRRDDTLDDILAAPERDALLTWLRHRPMLHAAHGYVMVHAGLLPQWSIAQASSLAREVEAALRASDYRDFLRAMYGSKPVRWQDDLQGWDRLRVVVNAMTRMRLCSDEGEMEFSHKGTLGHLPAGFMPWFRVAQRRSREATVICGHWSALGVVVEPDLLALDSGCVWGGALSAIRLEDRRLSQVACCAPARSASEQ